MKQVNFKWPNGFYSDATTAGFKVNQKLDLCWIVSDVPATAAGVYTKNNFQAAPLQVTKKQINQNHLLQALIINSGNANSFTNIKGYQNAEKETKLVADRLKIEDSLVGVASTGIIGKQLEMNKFEDGIKKLNLKNNLHLPEAILTTDSCEKKICTQLLIDEKIVTITGIAKGSGMIHPNMGTTLGFITTDAKIEAKTLQKLLNEEIINSFNQITVDGCMSTNDMVLTLANGKAENEILNENHPQISEFSLAFKNVLVTLAQKVAADGEGSNKFIETKVVNAQNKQQANHIARAIVGSNLVKAMLFGEDANWGRIVQAIGQTQEKINPNHICIKIGNQILIKNSQVVQMDKTKIKNILEQDNILLSVNLNNGDYEGSAWGCDLTYKYVEINAAYEE